MSPSARIAGLHVYPVKSCRGTALDAATLAERGFEHDREWMIVDARDCFITQRTHPRLARIVPTLTSGALRLAFDAEEPFELPLIPAERGPLREVRIWNDRVAAIDCGEPAARWLSTVLGDSVRLVRGPPDMPREPDARWRGEVRAPVWFPDGFPLLVCNSASLDDLNARMGADGPVPMSRFRPNIVIEGWPPWGEDALGDVAIGTARLRLVKPCLRCSTTSVDQLRGERAQDPLPHLKAFRFDRELLGVKFGQNAVIVDGIGVTLRLGASVDARAGA